MIEYSPELGLEKPREACGVAAIFAHDPAMPVGKLTFDLISSLQHRGQDAAGILITGEQTIMRAAKGLVPEVFSDEAAQLDANAPQAHMALGHTRYSTSGEGLMPYFGLVHNGHIANFEMVADKYGIEEKHRINDSQTVATILNNIRQENGGDLSAAMHELLPQLEGGYAIIATDGNRIIAARDPNGLKPLSLGQYTSEVSDGYVFASEDVAFKDNDIRLIREVEPGELITVDENGVHSEHFDRQVDEKLCMFEAVYYMDKRSSFRGISVEQRRYDMGRKLAAEHPVMSADIVVGVPNSSLPASQGYADEMMIPCEPGLIRNPHYEKGRTFILPTQEEREQAVRDKFIIVPELLDGKSIVLQDDSIVRSTTMKVLVRMIREAGAKEVHIRINSPPIKWPCFYGVNMGHSENDLIAANMLPREMAAALDADSISFLSEQHMAESMGVELGKLCMGCISGQYPTPVPMPKDRRGRTPRQPSVYRVA